MKLVGVISTVVFIGTMIPVYAQHEGQGEKPAGKEEQQRAQPSKPQPQQRAQQPKPQQEQQRAQQPKPQPQQRAQQPKPQQEQQRAQQAKPQPQKQQRAQQSKPQQQTQQARQQPQSTQPQRTKQQAQTWQQQKGWVQHGGWPAHASWQQNRSQNWASDHRTWAQRGGYGGYYIPQDSFNLYFGDQHFFRLGAVPVMYLGYPRFEYGGFAFLLVDPWPESWSANWYASDDVYIAYDNGYYLYDRRYPQTALAITIVL